MKSRVLISILIICSLLFANATAVHSKRQTKNVFKQLAENELGKDIYESILLELETSTDSKQIGQILNMLYDLRDGLLASQEEIEGKLTEKEETCSAQNASIEAEILNLQTQVGQWEAQIPIYTEAARVKTADANAKTAEYDTLNGQIAELVLENTAAVEAFNASNNDHDSMIQALEQAKEIISSLVTTGFLQQSGTSSLSQLDSHLMSTQTKLSKHQEMSMFKVLVKLAQDIGVQADQSQVASIIAIINELIAHEEETADTEYRIEQLRIQRYDFDLQRKQATLSSLNAGLLDLQADAKNLTLKSSELTADIATYEEQISGKQEQLRLSQKACNDYNAGLEQQQTSNGEILAIVLEVISIFESDEIQDLIPYIHQDTDFLDA